MVDPIYVYGHSDDLVEVVGEENDEIYALDTPHTFEVAGMSVVAEYDGTWSFDVASNPNATHFMIIPNDAIDKARFNDYTELVVIQP